MLRVAQVRAGRVIEERLIKDRGPFMVEGATLFEPNDPSYVLCIARGMSARIALESGVLEVEGHEGEPQRIPLTDMSRGRVVMGELTVLFQFVEPPPPQARPHLPLAVKEGFFSQIDWNFTIVAAFSFLLHFGFIGAMYSDWMDSGRSEGSSGPRFD